MNFFKAIGFTKSYSVRTGKNWYQASTEIVTLVFYQVEMYFENVQKVSILFIDMQ